MIVRRGFGFSCTSFRIFLRLKWWLSYAASSGSSLPWAHRRHRPAVPARGTSQGIPAGVPIISDTSGGGIMNKDQVKGAVKEAAGKVQQKTGEMTGSASQQVKGVAKQVEGKAQKAYGDAKDAMKKR